jgi:hypothetical protein
VWTVDERDHCRRTRERHRPIGDGCYKATVVLNGRQDDCVEVSNAPESRFVN